MNLWYQQYSQYTGVWLRQQVADCQSSAFSDRLQLPEYDQNHIYLFSIWKKTADSLIEYLFYQSIKSQPLWTDIHCDRSSCGLFDNFVDYCTSMWLSRHAAQRNSLTIATIRPLCIYIGTQSMGYVHTWPADPKSAELLAIQLASLRTPSWALDPPSWIMTTEQSAVLKQPYWPY